MTGPRATEPRGAAILAVEDEVRNAALLQAILVPAGYDLTIATSLAEARVRLGERTPALLLLDRHLGDGDGLDLARELHEDAATADIPILLDLILPDTDGPDLVARLKADPATADIPIWVTTHGHLDDAERARISGKVQGIVGGDDTGFDALKGWLERVAAGPARV